MNFPDLSHHRAYRSVHGGFLVFINVLVIARHGYVTMTGYFFYSVVCGIQVVPRQDLPQQTVRSQVCNDVVVFGTPHRDRRSRISLPLGSCFSRATFSMKFSAFNDLF